MKFLTKGISILLITAFMASCVAPPRPPKRPMPPGAGKLPSPPRPPR